MPEKIHSKIKPTFTRVTRDRVASSSLSYTELQTTSNFSFLRGASHPEELIQKAAELHYRAISITDWNTLAGIVRGYAAAKEANIDYIVGCRLNLFYEARYCQSGEVDTDNATLSVLAYPTTVASYASLSRLLSVGKQRSCPAQDASACYLSLDDFLPCLKDLALVLVPPFFFHENQYVNLNAADLNFLEACKKILAHTSDRSLVSIALTKNYSHHSLRHITAAEQTAKYLNIPLVATNDVYYHTPKRKPLQDVLTCIRHKTTLPEAGYLLFPNSERALKPPQELYRLFREHPAALTRSNEIAEMARSFSLDQLRYEYPSEICPEQKNPLAHLTELTWQGAAERYPDGVPGKVRRLILDELKLIHELEYEKYFLTCYDIVRFGRERNILCQGRGAAANSAVCFCLGITSVLPDKIDLLFARFVSKERNEPPDIDIDFEHERREEVIQYIYEKYGRDRAALTCEVVTYRHRSAVRDVGKALGLSLEFVDALAKSIHRWTKAQLSDEDICEIGLNPEDLLVQNTIALSNELLGFPRHLSQHVGGFIISERPLCEIVPIRNATMDARTIIEWDKDDIEVLGMLKIDVLALGMLTCIRKALLLINRERIREGKQAYELYSLPADDPVVYDMICVSDTVGVFQIESRAQMSMLPRLKPRTFYDLVIEVAIVRPGPIQGNMVHPFLKRRDGLEKPYYPDKRVEEILGKTLGVPIFQEQAMRLAIALADFTPGEAEQLRRSMAAWKKSSGKLAEFSKRIFRGMQRKGYSQEFAESCVNQLKGFSEYGFPESHAASFALLVYASAWIKKHHPAAFACALLNSQPMGFYAPSQLITDAKNNGVQVLPIDVNLSQWDSTIESKALRLGLRLIKGIVRKQADIIVESVRNYGKFSSIQDLWNKASLQEPQLRKHTLHLLAKANAFRSLNLSRREAIWEIRALPKESAPLDRLYTGKQQKQESVPLRPMTEQQEMFQDYDTTGFSLHGHPIGYIRKKLARLGVSSAQFLRETKAIKPNTTVVVAGISIFRQRPGTAKGVVFVTLEDETGITNLIVQKHIFDQYQKIILSSSCLLAKGALQRVGEVIYILAREITSLDHEVSQLVSSRFPMKSHSYC